jgi:hypothetical protein
LISDYRPYYLNDFNETVCIPADCTCQPSDFGITPAGSPDTLASLDQRILPCLLEEFTFRQKRRFAHPTFTTRYMQGSREA